MVPPNPVTIGAVQIGKNRPLALIAGPCVMEPGDLTAPNRAAAGRDLSPLGVPLIFKASFDKANRTSGSSFRGPGMDEGMKIFEAIKAETGLPVTTDVHETDPGRADRRGGRLASDPGLSGAADRSARSGGARPAGR